MSDIKSRIEAMNALISQKKEAIDPGDIKSIDPEAFRHYSDNEYLKDPIRKTNVTFTTEQLKEVKEMSAALGVTNMAEFLLKELRDLDSGDR